MKNCFFLLLVTLISFAQSSYGSITHPSIKWGMDISGDSKTVTFSVCNIINETSSCSTSIQIGLEDWKARKR